MALTYARCMLIGALIGYFKLKYLGTYLSDRTYLLAIKDR